MSLLCVLGLALAQDPVVLKPGVPFAGELRALGLDRQDFEVEVPPDQAFLKVRLVARAGDLDLYGGEGVAPEDLGDAPLASAGETGIEELVLDRLSTPPIAEGTWWFSVEVGAMDVLGSGEPPPSAFPFTVELTLLPLRTDAVLAPGPARPFALEPASGGFRTFRIDVPEQAAALRIDLHRAPANLDLFARRGAPMSTLETAFVRARHDWGAESIVLTKTSRPSLAAGPWFVDVMDAYAADAPIPFEIRVAFDAAPPPEWSTPPVLLPGDPARPLSRALACVLEVFATTGGGSATLLTPDGLALTNAHVVDRGDRHPVDEVVLAANLDPRRPPEEAFRGSVLRFDADLDLALIQVDHGFYDAPLSATYRFPTVELGPREGPQIGDPLWIVGYPDLGGTGSRVSIHCAHGVLSGFDREACGTVFKTDAAVIAGNSGGAALDAAGRLVGVPSANVSDGSGLVGLVTPIELMPEEWRALIAARVKR